MPVRVRKVRVGGKRVVKYKGAGYRGTTLYTTATRPYYNKPLTTFLKQVATLTSSSGTIQAWYDDNPGNATDWTSFASLYDQYRILAMKVNFYPSRPNDESATTTFAPMYVIYDPDSTGAGPATADIALQVEGCKVRDMNKPFSFYTKIRKQMSVQSGAVTISMGGWRDIGSVGATGGIKLLATGLNSASLYGTIVSKFYIQFRHRR